MTHQEIERHDVIEQYLRGQLGPEERRAFQEHFFECDECLEALQATERFIAGVRYAAEQGWLDPQATAQRDRGRLLVGPGWMKPLLTATASVAVLLAGVVAWLLLYRMPLMREELTRQEQTRRQLEQERQALTQAVEQLRHERELRQQLQNELARLAGVEANVPLVMLEATRAGESSVNTLVLPTRAISVVLWIEVGPGTRLESFRLELHSSDRQLIQAVDGLKKNAYGALAVGLPAESLRAGSYRVKLYGVNGQRTTLVGEYRIQVLRQ